MICLHKTYYIYVRVLDRSEHIQLFFGGPGLEDNNFGSLHKCPGSPREAVGAEGHEDSYSFNRKVVISPMFFFFVSICAFQYWQLSKLEPSKNIYGECQGQRGEQGRRK